MEQAFSYNTLSHMKPRTYRNHAWAQLAKSDTFYVRDPAEERRLQKALGLAEGEEEEDETRDADLEAPGAATLPTAPPAQLLYVLAEPVIHGSVLACPLF